MIEEIYLFGFFVLITGACIGSFLNVVALRALSKESIVFPASKCPVCNTPIKWYDNIPVLSYFLTFRGKCRSCGCKVSIQYPIVEATTALLFLAVFLLYGPTIKTVLILIWLCLAIVITITDIKKEYVFDLHSWLLIIFSIIASLWMNGLENYSIPAFGLIAGYLIMEIIARLSYYLVKKEENKEETAEGTKSEEIKEEIKTEENLEKTEENNDEDIDINEYVKKNKRAFGEGDSYLAAAAGALLGWKYIFVALALAIILQAVCILPQFIINLYKQNKIRLLSSIVLFFLVAVIYWVLSNLVTLPIVLALFMVIVLIFFAIDTITGLKKYKSEGGFVAIPFGPALLISTFLTLILGRLIVLFLLKHIFM